MAATVTPTEEAQLSQTIEMFEVITQSDPSDYQSLEILKEAYLKLGRNQDVINTSKRIGQAYVQLGQLSSAILEYETILQRTPDDSEVLEALNQIEQRAGKMPGQMAPEEPAALAKPVTTAAPVKMAGRTTPGAVVEDGKSEFLKFLVETKLLAQSEFDACWVPSDLSTPPLRVAEPFALRVVDRKHMSEEHLLRLLCERARLAFVPLGRYDLDLELARSFPAVTCRRWCVLPFDRMSKSILVATANPFNRQAARELQDATPNRLIWYVAPPNDLVTLIQRAFR